MLHNHAGTHATNMMSLAETAGSSTAVSFHVYFAGDGSVAPYDQPNKAYATYVTFTGTSTDGKLGTAMGFPNPAPSTSPYHSPIKSVTASDGTPRQLSYTAVKNGANWYIESFTLTNPATHVTQHYNLPFNETTKREPFWYYSFGGQAIEPDIFGIYSKTPGAVQGTSAIGFNEAELNDQTTVFWQGIAPDTLYGFAPCFAVDGKTSIQLGANYSTRHATGKGYVYYENTVSNIFIDSAVKSWKLASTSDGAGKIITDDEVTLTVITGTENTQIFSRDFSKGGTGNFPTDPADITKALAPYTGQHVTLQIVYQDLHGGLIGSNAYFLVPSLT